MRKMRAAAGTAVFLVIAPGVVAGLIPWWLTDWQAGSTYPGRCGLPAWYWPPRAL